MNASEAAINAGYSIRSSRQIASNLLKDVEVAELIQELSDKATQRAQIEIDDIVAGLKSIAENEEEKTSDRIRAYEILGRHLNMFTDRLEVIQNKPQVVLYWPENGRDLPAETPNASVSKTGSDQVPERDRIGQ